MTPLGRALVWFWLVIVAVAGTGMVALQLLGPPSSNTTGTALARVPDRPPTGLRRAGGPTLLGPIAAPDPGLLETLPTVSSGGLPRIAADGRKPMDLYSGVYDRTVTLPRIALLLAGVGLNVADSEDAIRSLPAAITLAFSPYSNQPDRLLEAARLSRHEYLLSVALEPRGAPLNDAGTLALLVGASPEQNVRRLHQTLGRIAGYAGVTGALGGLRGERFSAAADPMDAMLRELASRGLFYVDTRPETRALPHVWGRGIDLVVDEPPVRAEIDARLTQLEQLARERGSAIGLIGAPLPTSIGRVAVWASGLTERGFALVPVSALAQPAAEIATAARP